MMQADWNFSRQLQNLLGVMDNVSAYTQGIFSKIKVVNHFIVWKKKKKGTKENTKSRSTVSTFTRLPASHRSASNFQISKPMRILLAFLWGDVFPWGDPFPILCIFHLTFNLVQQSPFQRHTFVPRVIIIYQRFVLFWIIHADSAVLYSVHLSTTLT